MNARKRGIKMENVYGSPYVNKFNIYSSGNKSAKDQNEIKMQIGRHLSRECSDGLMKSVRLLTQSILNLILKEVK